MMRDVLIAGGGTTGLECALALRALAPDRVRVTVLAPSRHFTQRSFDGRAAHAVRLPLALLAREAGFELLRDAVDRVDAAAHVVRTQDGVDASYDGLVLAVGARQVTAVPGAFTFRGPQDVQRLRERLERLPDQASPRVVVALPAASLAHQVGYTLALHVASWLADAGVGSTVTVVTPEAEPLQGVPDREEADRLRAGLDRLGVAVRVRSAPGPVEEGRLWLPQEDSMAADLVVALPYDAGPALPGVPSDEDGFAQVGPDHRVDGLEDVWAVGDMTTRRPAWPATAGDAEAVARAVVGWAGGANHAPDGTKAVGGPTRRYLSPYLDAHGEHVGAAA